MENNSVIREVKHDEHCFVGYLGAFLGGIVGILPWMLLYLYSSTNFLILVALIPICALKGYQFFKGVVNKKTTSTIIIISIIVLLFSQIILLPELYGNKYDINLKEFYESIHGSKYIEERLDELEASIMLVVLGFVFAAVEINKILKKYNATNQMIRDTGTISLRKNSPIKGDGYVSPVKTSKDSANVDKWDDEGQDFIVPKKKVTSNLGTGYITRTTITNDGNVYIKRYNNNNNNVRYSQKQSKNLAKIMIIIFFVPVIIQIIMMFFAVLGIGKFIDTQSTTMYDFPNHTLQMEVSSEWEIDDTKYTDSILIENSETSGTAVIEIYDKDIYIYEFDSLNEFREYTYGVVTQNFIPTTYRTLINRTLGSNSACKFYYETTLSSGEEIRLVTYCIETENYFIAYIAPVDIDYDINDYTEYIEEYLTTIEDSGYSSDYSY